MRVIYNMKYSLSEKEWIYYYNDDYINKYWYEFITTIS